MVRNGLELIRDGWFMEKSDFWPGQAMGIQVKEILHHSVSNYQDILVFSSLSYGNVLVLDGIIQCTERDEFAYQEMLAHLPLFSHPNPEKVLIVGGGDGGVLREVLRHPSVKQAVLCEIDETVINVAKKFFPAMSCSFNDARAKVLTMDGAKFMNEHINEYDVIITDSSDPIGPAEVLFQKPYYEAIHKSLRSGGLASSQGECLWLDGDLIASVLSFCRSLFSVVEYAYTTVPTYPSGQIGFVLCGKSPGGAFRYPSRIPSPKLQDSLRYYNPDIHKASFFLPEFARKMLSIRNSEDEKENAR